MCIYIYGICIYISMTSCLSCADDKLEGAQIDFSALNAVSSVGCKSHWKWNKYIFIYI